MVSSKCTDWEWSGLDLGLPFGCVIPNPAQFSRVRISPARARRAGDPSLRLKYGYGQDDPTALSGLMFWLSRNTLPGSYFFLIPTRRA